MANKNKAFGRTNKRQMEKKATTFKRRQCLVQIYAAICHSKQTKEEEKMYPRKHHVTVIKIRSTKKRQIRKMVENP